MNWVYVTISFGIVVGGYYGYEYGKRRFAQYVMGRVSEELNKRMEKEEEQELFKPVHKNSAVIKVTQGGKTHSVYVPYDRRKSTAMLRKKVYLIKDNEKVELSQKPGVPFMVTPSQLGGQAIIFEDMEGNVLKTFTEDEIPVF